jgi:hypothetical protein
LHVSASWTPHPSSYNSYVSGAGLVSVPHASQQRRVTTGIQFQRKTWIEAEMFVAPIGDDEVTMLFMTFVAASAA